MIFMCVYDVLCLCVSFCFFCQAWTLEVSPDGSFVLSGGHDRSLRMWRRTEEMVFLDEEREKEMEGLFESELDRDDVAAPGADGFAPPPPRKPEGKGGKKEGRRLAWPRRGGEESGEGLTCLLAINCVLENPNCMMLLLCLCVSCCSPVSMITLGYICLPVPSLAPLCIIRVLFVLQAVCLSLFLSTSLYLSLTLSMLTFTFRVHIIMYECM